MNFHDCMKSAVDYIEEHLDDNIDYDMAAQKACCSTYHFQRMFSYVIGIPLAEYIRRRRMTLAAFELQKSDVKIVDLAVTYGYDSQSSFTRAFQAFHGITPTSVRNVGVVIKAYPRVSFHFIIKGEKDMDYRIEKTAPFSIFGATIQLDTNDGKFENIFSRLGVYARDVLENGTHDATNLAAGRPAGSLLTSVRFDFKPDGSCKFMFAAKLPDKGVGDAFTVLPIPATTWVVFGYKQVIYPETTSELYERIYSEWFPTSGYEQAEGPCLEYYPNDKMEVWIPIQQKS